MAGDVLEVGDVMRWSPQLVEAVRSQDPDRDLLVKVIKIQRHADGTVGLWLENADAGGDGAS